MKFSRRAVQEDFIRENKEWEEILHPDILTEYHSGNKGKAVLTHKSYNGCGVQTSKQAIENYTAFLHAWNDFKEGKEVFVQY
ncbi:MULTISPECIES: hypothetical protein [Paenibacillus]|uniref:hypothetical protein n=1 Tax=Paenibacillus TaxID=44249 RepID=UPI0007BF310F|nr:hypothetical protein [Paenibacillus sp. O199]